MNDQRKRMTGPTLRGPVFAMGLMVALSPGVFGCAAARAGAPPGEPVADPGELVRSLQRSTRPTSPQQVTFAWTLDEAGSRVRGRGVVRYEAPERLRLDLFGPRGESYLSAALVGEEFRMPPAAAQGVALPSPSLLWAALGVFRVPPGAELTSATAGATESALRYELGDRQRLEFRAASVGDELLLTRVERAGPTGVVETLQLEREPSGRLSRTRYRDLSAYRDLIFEIEEARDVSSFPAEIWRPDA